MNSLFRHFIIDSEIHQYIFIKIYSHIAYVNLPYITPYFYAIVNFLDIVPVNKKKWCASDAVRHIWTQLLTLNSNFSNL